MNVRRASLWAAGSALLIAVGWFYYWTVGSPGVFSGKQTDYYNLLIEGFEAGSLAMKVTPEPIQDESSGRVTPFLLDASFYRGKYYLYFGATPAIVLLWPWSIITGNDLPEGISNVLLALLALLLSLGWLRTLLGRFAPQTGLWFWLMAVLVLGVGSGYPVVLRHPRFYEIAVFSGVACSMGGLWCLTLAILQRGRAALWLLGGSLCAGLAAGSRPTLTPGAVLAVALAAGYVAWCESRENGGWRIGRTTRLALAAVMPAGICGLLLAWYNWARFGSPWEFGLIHQQGSNPDGFGFTLHSLWANLRLYYLTPPSFSWFFPFFSPGSNPPGIFREQAHGQFFILPVMLVVAAGGGRAFWRILRIPRPLTAVLGSAAVWSGVALVVDCMAPPHANRYQLDFHPVLLVLTLLGLAMVGWRQSWQWPVRAALAWCAVVVAFNLCTSFHVHGFFREHFPREYSNLARKVNRLVWPVHRLTGPRLGGLELVVKFPKHKPGGFEPLLVAGGGPDMDGLMIKHTTPGRGRIVFIHPDYGGVESEEFELQAGRARWLKVHLGTLYPPAGHPWYDSLPSDMSRARNRVAVQIDGRTILDRDVVCHQASSNQVVLGKRDDFLIGDPKFNGMISRVRGLKADLDWRHGLDENRRDTRRLRLLLPQDRFGSEEPLIMTGERGRTDLLSIQYIRRGVFRLALYHEGWSAPVQSMDIPWDYRNPLELFVRLGSLGQDQLIRQSQPQGLMVEMDGRIVFSHDYLPYPAQPTEVYLGCLPWPLVRCRLMFGGFLDTNPPESWESAALRRAKHSLLTGQQLELKLTAGLDGRNQPIITTGITGRGDCLYMVFISDTEIRLGFDHWGSQPLLSTPLPFATDQPHHLSVALGAVVSGQMTVRGRLTVQLDGQPVFDHAVDLFPADADLVFFGANPIGMSTSIPEWTGRIELLDNLNAGSLPDPTNP